MENPGESHGSALKRLRAARACEMCRLKKNKCDEQSPCTHCKNRKTKCIYRGVNNVRSSSFTHSEYIRQLEEQVIALSSSPAHAKTGSNAAASTAISPSPGLLLGGLLSGGERSGTDWIPAQPVNDPQARSRAGAQEVIGVNCHTRSFEFYGSSSSVALLARVRNTGDRQEPGQHGREDQDDDDDEDQGEDEALVSSLHNPAFSVNRAETAHAPLTAADTGMSAQSPSVSHCRLFVDSFFATLHYIYPILDKAAFLGWCELIWTGNTSSLSQSFIALYYSVLSLGALLRPREEEPMSGADNVKWSRKCFDEARRRSSSAMVTDLEMVQCNFFLAKVCQNELSPHWAYMHIGMAVRIALSIGINREPPANCKKDPAFLRTESRTWWGLYFLETETAFSIGRPDTLGADLYHNRRYPMVLGDPLAAGTPPELLEPPHCAIIKYMVDLSRITRSICLHIYLSDLSLERAVEIGGQIERDLERWVESLPPALRPLGDSGQKRPLRAAMEPQYVKKQRLATTVRYHNLRILLFGPLLTKASTVEHACPVEAKTNIAKCLDSARLTIEIIYETYQHQDFFRTWFYNTTYTLFAASIILVYISQAAEERELQALFKLVQMAVEILETMEESVVVAKAAKLIQRALARAQRRAHPGLGNAAGETVGEGSFLPFNQPWSPFGVISAESDFSLPFQFGYLGADAFFGDLSNEFYDSMRPPMVPEFH